MTAPMEILSLGHVVDPLISSNNEGRNRANLDALLREVAARGVGVSADPNVIIKMGTKEVLHRTRMMSWGSNTALYTNDRGDAS